MIILEENFKWHLEAFASELFIYFIYIFAFGTVIQLTLHSMCTFYHSLWFVCLSLMHILFSLYNLVIIASHSETKQL